MITGLEPITAQEVAPLPPQPEPKTKPHPDGIDIPDVPKGRNLSDEEFKQWREESKQAAADRLLLALTNLCNEDVFRRFCEQRSHFWNYSWLNQLLIWMQYPTTTRVASIATWNSLKRRVNKGEKAIRIWYPLKKSIIRTDPDSGAPIIGADGKPEIIQITVGFNIGRVFDVEQTSGEPLVALPMPTDYHGEDSLSRMAIIHIVNKLAIGKVGYSTQELGYTGDITKVAKGYYRRSNPEEIVIQQGLPSQDHLAVLIHETAHMLVYNRNKWDDTEQSYRNGELLAEGVAAIVMSTLGYDISTFAVPYLGWWLAAGGGDIANPTEEAIATTRLVMYEMMNVSDTILDWLRPLTSETAIAYKYRREEQAVAGV